MKKKYLIPDIIIETIVTGTSLLNTPGSPNTVTPGKTEANPGTDIGFGGN